MAVYTLKDYSLKSIQIPSRGLDQSQKIDVLELKLNLINSSGNESIKTFYISPDTRHTLASAQNILHDGLGNAKKIQGKIEQRYDDPRYYLWIGVDLTGSKKREHFQFTASKA